MLVQLYNTLTRRRDAIRPLQPGQVRMYTCGPTVYRYVQIGNLRTFLLADLLRRTLELEGISVRQIKNITDVGHLTDEMFDRGEDKMLVAARLERKTPEEIAAFYTQAYLTDERSLNILPAEVFPRASQHIDEMIRLVERLLSRGHAYLSGSAVYFDVASQPEYGRLSGNSQESLWPGRRMALDRHKRNPGDFVLWNIAASRRIMKWPSPWGEGYPGWHVECSAMSLKYLGEQFDIHTGGVDNIFPHHEDEIAQGLGAFGKVPAQHWAHGAHLTVDGRRMAKSTGNVVRIADLVEHGIEPLAFRYLCLTTRYRARINFTWAAAEAAAHALDRLRRSVDPGPHATVLGEDAVELDEAFRAALLADLDTPSALVSLERMVGSRIPAAEKRALLRRWDRVLGLDLAPPAHQEAEALDPEEEAWLNARARARDRRDYAEADRLRGMLAAHGVELADSPDGTRWRRAQVTDSSHRE